LVVVETEVSDGGPLKLAEGAFSLIKGS